MVDKIYSDIHKRYTFSQDLVLAGITLLIVVAALYKSLILFALVGIILIVLAVPFASLLLIGFFTCLIGLVLPMSIWPVPAFGFKFYSADGFAFFFFAFVIHTLYRIVLEKVTVIKRPSQEIRLIVVMIIIFFFGFVEIAKGISQGFTINDVLGDFRRMFFYPMAFIVPLYLTINKKYLSLLKYSIVCGGTIMILLGLYRLATGQSVSEEYYTRAEYKPRLYESSETVSLQFMLAYLAAALRFHLGGFRRTIAFILAGLAAAFLFISGWRLAFCFVIIAPFFAFIIIAHIRGEKMRGFLKAMILSMLVVVSMAIILSYLFKAQTEEHKGRLLERFSSFDYLYDARYYAWQQALSDFSSDPVLGTGLGHQLFVFAKTSDGADLGRPMTAHSYPIDVLYQTGLIGFTLFFLMHLWFNIYFWRRICSIPNQFQATAIGLYIGYCCSMAMHSLEPCMTASIVALYMIMGFLVRLLRMTYMEEDNAPVIESGINLEKAVESKIHL